VTFGPRLAVIQDEKRRRRETQLAAEEMAVGEGLNSERGSLFRGFSRRPRGRAARGADPDHAPARRCSPWRVEGRGETGEHPALSAQRGIGENKT